MGLRPITSQRWKPVTQLTNHLPGGATLRSNPSAFVPLAALVAIVLVATFARLLAPRDPITPAGPSLLSPSPHFWLGTDEVGRDILSRVLLGLQSTLWATFCIICVGAAVGTAVGALAGTAGGILDDFSMRLTDLFLALPGPLVAIIIVSALGPSLQHTIIAVSIGWWPYYARIVRGQVRALAVRPHMEAARLAGVGPLRRLWRHLLPGVLPIITVVASLDVGAAVLTISSLSFLGLGSPAPAPELGAMTAQGLPYLLDEWWIPLTPAFVVFLIAYLSNLAGDAVGRMLQRA